MIAVEIAEDVDYREIANLVARAELAQRWCGRRRLGAVAAPRQTTQGRATLDLSIGLSRSRWEPLFHPAKQDFLARIAERDDSFIQNVGRHGEDTLWSGLWLSVEIDHAHRLRPKALRDDPREPSSLRTAEAVSADEDL